MKVCGLKTKKQEKVYYISFLCNENMKDSLIIIKKMDKEQCFILMGKYILASFKMD